MIYKKIPREWLESRGEIVTTLDDGDTEVWALSRLFYSVDRQFGWLINIQTERMAPWLVLHRNRLQITKLEREGPRFYYQDCSWRRILARVGDSQIDLNLTPDDLDSRQEWDHIREETLHIRPATQPTKIVSELPSHVISYLNDELGQSLTNHVLRRSYLSSVHVGPNDILEAYNANGNRPVTRYDVQRFKEGLPL